MCTNYIDSEGLSCGSKESAHNAGALSLIPRLERCPGEGKDYPLQYSGLENSMQLYRLQRIGDNWAIFTHSLTRSKKAMAPHSSTLAWKIPWMEEPERLQSMGSLRVGHDWATSLSLFTFMHWRRKWQPTPVFLPGESQGWGSLVGCRLGVTQSWTRLKRLSSSSSTHSLTHRQWNQVQLALRVACVIYWGTNPTWNCILYILLKKSFL